MRKSPTSSFAAIATMFALYTVTYATANDWPFFLGPNFNGVSSETGWKKSWPDSGPKIAWKKELGTGAASFTVVGNRVCTIGNVNDQDIVYCLNPENGNEIWTFKFACPLNNRQFEGGPAATPTLDENSVYTLSWDGNVYCLNLKDGSVIWHKNLITDFGGSPPTWKFAGSPLVQDEMLILDAGGNGSSTLALNKRTGEKIWGVGSDGAGYATPIPFNHGTTRAVMVFKGKALVAYTLKEGETLWRIPWETAHDVNASSPFIIKDKLFISSGYPNGRGALYQLTAGEPQQLWVNENLKTKMNTCVQINGYIYGITEKGGTLMCISLVDGKTSWSKDGFGRSGTLMAADGKIVALTESGTLIIVQADGNEYRELARAEILKGRCWVMPVLANGRVFCKANDGKMVCVDLRN